MWETNFCGTFTHKSSTRRYRAAVWRQKSMDEQHRGQAALPGKESLHPRCAANMTKSPVVSDPIVWLREVRSPEHHMYNQKAGPATIRCSDRSMSLVAAQSSSNGDGLAMSAYKTLRSQFA